MIVFLSKLTADHFRPTISLLLKNPDRLQKLIDEGRIIEFLEELDIKIRDAIMDQAEKLMNEDFDYRAAVESGNLVEVGRIGNMFTEKAREIVYPAMVYV
ncbi:MAG: hypothetical protein PUB89_04910 [Oscillospiraceae bacterium]|nr:hypothetical protein [Oscillospiraceae bacterium]